LLEAANPTIIERVISREQIFIRMGDPVTPKG
jgi:hypothetical protein